eukprot:m.196636 g.196636  ORF g.196636 m.196636 type:complete len:115 (+) comp15257_c0_seq1:1290-1634(+)
MAFDSIVSFIIMDPPCHCNHSQSPLTFRVNLNKAQVPVVQKNDDNTIMKRHELSCLQNCGRNERRISDLRRPASIRNALLAHQHFNTQTPADHVDRQQHRRANQPQCGFSPLWI